MIGLPIYSRLLLCSSLKFSSFIYIVPVHFLLWLFWGISYHSFLNQLQSDLYLLILVLLLLKKREREKEGRSGNYWKDIEEYHRIKRRELSFRRGREDWYQGWLDSAAETQSSLSLSLSHCSSLISIYFCIWLHSDIFITQKEFSSLVLDIKISGKGSDWPRGSHACYQRYLHLYCQRDVMLRLVPSEYVPIPVDREVDLLSDEREEDLLDRQ